MDVGAEYEIIQVTSPERFQCLADSTPKSRAVYDVVLKILREIHAAFNPRNTNKGIQYGSG